MEYPSLVYKDGGKYKRPGGTYSYRAVNSDSDLAAAKELGWCRSLDDACNPKEAAKPKQEEPKPKKAKQKVDK